MKLISTTTGLFALAAVASPISQNAAHGAISRLESRRETINDCGDSSFTNDTSDGSPLVADCLELATLLVTEWGDNFYTTGAIGLRSTLVEHKSCVVGGQYNVGGSIPKVGNQDIADIIRTSVEMFQWTDGNGDARVGAEGVMQCQGMVIGDYSDVWWGIWSA